MFVVFCVVCVCVCVCVCVYHSLCLCVCVWGGGGHDLVHSVKLNTSNFPYKEVSRLWRTRITRGGGSGGGGGGGVKRESLNLPCILIKEHVI